MANNPESNWIWYRETSAWFLISHTDQETIVVRILTGEASLSIRHHIQIDIFLRISTCKQRIKTAVT
ncbi:hypothetical protein [Labilibaculum manganireducens]|uniref:hypothetical protein n=1 Tax=Labilibaculum manganireducens TaxID=1940525 RepID=UPI0029F535CC|nr:hypothetical protein [Labilibaculum manganireducens]